MRALAVILLAFLATPVFPQRTCIKATYDSQVGIREEGNNAGSQVEEYLRAAGVPVGSPWCASFIFWAFRQCDPGFTLSGPAWSPSWFPQNKLIYVLGKVDKANPQAGDVIGIYFPEKKRIAHVGFYDTQDERYYITVEGNTNDWGSREGDGVYKKKRIKRQVYAISTWMCN